MLGENLLIWFTIAMNLLNSVTDVGGLIFLIASVFFGSGEIPLSSMTWPITLHCIQVCSISIVVIIVGLHG